MLLGSKKYHNGLVPSEEQNRYQESAKGTVGACSSTFMNLLINLAMIKDDARSTDVSSAGNAEQASTIGIPAFHNNSSYTRAQNLLRELIRKTYNIDDNNLPSRINLQTLKRLNVSLACDNEGQRRFSRIKTDPESYIERIVKKHIAQRELLELRDYAIDTSDNPLAFYHALSARMFDADESRMMDANPCPPKVYPFFFMSDLQVLGRVAQLQDKKDIYIVSYQSADESRQLGHRDGRQNQYPRRADVREWLESDQYKNRRSATRNLGSSSSSGSSGGFGGSLGGGSNSESPNYRGTPETYHLKGLKNTVLVVQCLEGLSSNTLSPIMSHARENQKHRVVFVYGEKFINTFNVPRVVWTPEGFKIRCSQSKENSSFKKPFLNLEMDDLINETQFNYGGRDNTAEKFNEQSLESRPWYNKANSAESHKGLVEQLRSVASSCSPRNFNILLSIVDDLVQCSFLEKYENVDDACVRLEHMDGGEIHQGRVAFYKRYMERSTDTDTFTKKLQPWTGFVHALRWLRSLKDAWVKIFEQLIVIMTEDHTGFTSTQLGNQILTIWDQDPYAIQAAKKFAYKSKIPGNESLSAIELQEFIDDCETKKEILKSTSKSPEALNYYDALITFVRITNSKNPTANGLAASIVNIVSNTPPNQFNVIKPTNTSSTSGLPNSDLNSQPFSFANDSQKSQGPSFSFGQAQQKQPPTAPSQQSTAHAPWSFSTNGSSTMPSVPKLNDNQSQKKGQTKGSLKRVASKRGKK